MKNLVQASPLQDGVNRLTLTAPDGGSTSGKITLFGNLVSAAMNDVAAGEKGVYVTEQVISYAKADGAEFDEGDPVYYDADEDEITDDDDSEGDGNPEIGLAVRDNNGYAVFRMLLRVPA